MKQLALARLKHEESFATHTIKPDSRPIDYLRVATPTIAPVRVPASNKQQNLRAPLQLSSVIGNRAMQRMLASPGVQRSLWDDVTETVSEATDWLSEATETAPQQSWESDPQTDDANASEEALEHGDDSAFMDAVDADLDTAPDQTSSGSWFDTFFSDTQTEQSEFLTDEAATETNTNAVTDQCKDIEQELNQVQQQVEELYDLSQNMLPAVEAAKKEYEDLKKSAPGSAKTQAAKDRFDRLLAEYNEVVENCLQLMAYRDQLRADLAACRENEKKKMPKGFPCC